MRISLETYVIIEDQKLSSLGCVPVDGERSAIVHNDLLGIRPRIDEDTRACSSGERRYCGADCTVRTPLDFMVSETC